MRQEFQGGFHQSVYPLATAVPSSSSPSPMPTSSTMTTPSLAHQQLSNSHSGDPMEECIDSSQQMQRKEKVLESDEYDDEYDTSGDDQSDPSLSSPRRQQLQQQSPGTASTSSFSTATTSTGAVTMTSPTTVPPQAMFLNFTSDLEPHVNMKASNKPKKAPAFKLNGVNLLNRKNVDSKTAIERIQRRRENHNHVERRRRDNINNTIFELSRIVPNAVQPGQKLNKGKVLKMALDHILELQRENEILKERRVQPNEDRTPGNLTLSERFTKHGDSIPQSGGCETTKTTIQHALSSTSISTSSHTTTTTATTASHSAAELMIMNSFHSNHSSSGIIPQHRRSNSSIHHQLSSHVLPSAPNSPVESNNNTNTNNNNNTMHISPQPHSLQQHSLSLPNSPLTGPIPNMTLPPLHVSTMSFSTSIPTYHHQQHHPILHPPPTTHHHSIHNHQHHSILPMGIRHQTTHESNINNNSSNTISSSSSSSSNTNVLPPLQYEKLYHGTCKF